MAFPGRQKRDEIGSDSSLPMRRKKKNEIFSSMMMPHFSSGERRREESTLGRDKCPPVL